MCSTIAGVGTSVKATFGFVNVDSADERQWLRDTIEKRMRNKQEQFILWIVPIMSNTFATVLAIFAFNAAMGKSRWLSPEQDVTFISGFLVCIVWQRCPNICRAIRPSVFPSCLMLHCGMWVLLARNQVAVAFSSTLSMLPRVVLSATFPTAHAVVFWNAFYLVISSAAYIFSKDESGCADVFGRSPIYELLSDILLISCVVSVRMVVRDNIEYEIENAETKNGLGAAVALLNTLCDASVEMDERFVISGDSARLGAMLLHGSSRSLRGSDFLKFIPAAKDRESFVARARARINMLHQEDALADRFNVRVRDSANNEIDVEIFLLAFTSLCSRTKFLVGIREQAADVIDTTSSTLPTVSFDAFTFELIEMSPCFDLRGPNGSCKSGDCLLEWLVPCTQNDSFLSDVEIARSVVEVSKKSFSSRASLILKNLVKPDTAHLPGHCFLVDINYCVSFAFKSVNSEQLTERASGIVAFNSEAARTSRSWDDATDISGRGVEPRDGGFKQGGDAVVARSTHGRMIVSIELDGIERVRTQRNMTRL